MLISAVSPLRFETPMASGLLLLNSLYQQHQASCQHDLMQVMGLQHALAMVGGIVTPPLIISYLQKDSGVANCEYMELNSSVVRS